MAKPTNPAIAALIPGYDEMTLSERRKARARVYPNFWSAERRDRASKASLKSRAIHRDVHDTAIRRRKYGLTPDAFDVLTAVANGSCMLCGVATKKFHIDHDHATGRVRGLLCLSCNHGLGNFKDDPRLMRIAADYIERER